jgi:hypothetical protein
MFLPNMFLPVIPVIAVMPDNLVSVEKVFVTADKVY